MNFDSLFKRFFHDWQKFGWMGLGAFLVQLVAGAGIAVLAVALVGPGIFSLIQADAMGIEIGPSRAIGLLGALGGVALVSLVVGVLAGGLTTAGLVGSIVGYRRGEDVNLGSFWGYATHYFGKMILLSLIFVGIMIVSMVLAIIPVLGWIALFIWIPTAAVTLTMYPAYLIIGEGYDVTAAVRLGFRVLTSQFGEALLGGAILLGFSIVLSLVGSVPLIGWIAVGIFGEPLLLFLFAERFDSEVRPKLVG